MEWWNHFRMVKVKDRMKVAARLIVGSVSNGRDYDSNWVRWVEEERDVTVLESVKTLGFDSFESEASPITLLRYRSEFFVESDGHRRVSAARRLGVAEIEAEVYELQPHS